jgi:hypothetical protein
LQVYRLFDAFARAANLNLGPSFPYPDPLAQLDPNGQNTLRWAVRNQCGIGAPVGAKTATPLSHCR